MRDRVLHDVAKECGLDVAAIQGSRRYYPLVLARAEVARRLDAADLTMPQIGEVLRKHPSTIFYYLGRGARKLVERPRKGKTRYKRKWRAPGVREVQVAPPKPKPKQFLVPYAGADIAAVAGGYKYKLKERPPREAET